jgi:hypothetical protein
VAIFVVRIRDVYIAYYMVYGPYIAYNKKKVLLLLLQLVVIVILFHA